VKPPHCTALPATQGPYFSRCQTLSKSLSFPLPWSSGLAMVLLSGWVIFLGFGASTGVQRFAQSFVCRQCKSPALLVPNPYCARIFEPVARTSFDPSRMIVSSHLMPLIRHRRFAEGREVCVGSSELLRMGCLARGSCCLIYRSLTGRTCVASAFVEASCPTRVLLGSCPIHPNAPLLAPLIMVEVLTVLILQRSNRCIFSPDWGM